MLSLSPTAPTPLSIVTPDPSVIVAPPEKDLVLPSEDVCVVLTEESLQTVKKAAAVLQIADVALVGDGNNIFLTVRDKKNSGSNSYRIMVGQTESVFQFNAKVENLKVLPVTTMLSFPRRTLLCSLPIPVL